MTPEQSNDHIHTRRGFLMNSFSMGGGLVAANFFQAFGVNYANASGDDLTTIFNLAATAEMLAISFYYAAITSATFQISEEGVDSLKLVMDAEMHHLQIMQSLGGRALTQQFYLPSRMLSDASVFVETGLKIETIFAGAYLAATHQFAVLGQPKLAATAAQHGASEAQHITLLSHLAGLGASSPTLPTPIFAHTSDALPSLAPFLKGGVGFSETMRAPSRDAYDMALDGTAAIRGQSFVQAYGPDKRND